MPKESKKVSLKNWSVVGNAGTDPQTNFLGTKDEQPLIIRTNGAEIIRVNTSGNVGVGIPQPQAKLAISSGGLFDTPQLHLEQKTPEDFVRLRLNTSEIGVGDPGAPHPPGPQPKHHWDIAVGGPNNVLNIFHQGAEGVQGPGNVMTFVPQFRVVNDQPREVVLVGIGTEHPETPLHVNGTATVGVLQILGGGDLAEPFSVEDTANVEPGTVMVIDPDHPGQLKISESAYDRKVAGIISGAGGLNPGLMLGSDCTLPTKTLVALTGRVYCKAEAISNSIEPGDLLTTSTISGHAMKAADRQASHGAILGKAMSPLKEGKGHVLVLVNLQ